jgi:hypothetical protein
MDDHLFDELVQILGAVASRRGALAGLASALFAVSLPAPGGGETAAKKKRGQKKRKEKKKGGVGGDPSSPPTGCARTCAASNPCGDDGCGGSCGICAGGEACQSGQCICAPICAASNACGPDGCNGSCGSCSQAITCQGPRFIQEVCDGGTCTPVLKSCDPGQVCFQNACCPPRPPLSCREQPMSDGCGGTYQANCLTHCCDAPGGGLVCQETPCP